MGLGKHEVYVETEASSYLRNTGWLKGVTVDSSEEARAAYGLMFESTAGSQPEFIPLSQGNNGTCWLIDTDKGMVLLISMKCGIGAQMDWQSFFLCQLIVKTPGPFSPSSSPTLCCTLEGLSPVYLFLPTIIELLTNVPGIIWPKGPSLVDGGAPEDRPWRR
jgi:hypothetical protein